MGVVLVLVVVLVTQGKQSQLLVRFTWTGMDLDWSLTKSEKQARLRKVSAQEIRNFCRLKTAFTVPGQMLHEQMSASRLSPCLYFVT